MLLQAELFLRKDYDELKEAGVAAIYGPGTAIPDAVTEILSLLKKELIMDIEQLLQKLKSGDRRSIAKAITLLESSREN